MGLRVTSGINKLGDQLTIVTGLNNYAAQNNIKIDISFTNYQAAELFSDLLEIFDFHNLSPTNPPGGIPVDRFFLDAMYPYMKGGLRCDTWLRQVFHQLHREWGGCGDDDRFVLPVSKLPPYQSGTGAAVQFDSRSADVASFKKPMSVAEMLTTIKVLSASNNFFVVGGVDTLPYLGEHHEYRRKRLAFIAQQLLKCDRFIGCDSGISLIAAILGVPCTIVALGRTGCVERFYADFNNVKVVDRKTARQVLFD